MKYNNITELDRMKSLINYGKVEENTQSGAIIPRVEYSQKAADGKTYGIIRECNKFYIKVAPKKDTEVLAEDFDYIGGINNRRENEYATYAKASKQFDLKMMSINEAHAVKVPVEQFKEPKKVEMALWKIIPPEKGSDFCHRLVIHGREICTARTKPYCDRCCLADICKKEI